MDWLIFLIASLATFRSALLFSEDEGPFSVFRKMRRSIPPSTNAGRGIRCSRCWSVWCGAAVTGFLVWLGSVPTELSPLYWLGLSGASVLLHRLHEGNA